MATYRNGVLPLIAICGVINSGASHAATITLVGTNSLGQSWETGSDWSDGNPASSGNDYLLDSTFSLRTPEDATDDLFPGDSLTINATTTSAGIAFKGSSAKTVTINDLRIGGGRINIANNQTFTLAGNLDVFNATPPA